MCSVSWQQEQDEIVVCFNRDEQRTRAIAESPKVYRESSTQVIMPTDPDGGGTWISVNQYGVFLGLLNFYEANIGNKSQEILVGSYISRGLLIRELSCCENLSDFEVMLSPDNLKQYQPFKIIFISKNAKKLFVWNGVILSNNVLDNFISSSSFNTQSVLKYRYKQFEQAENDLLKLHTDHTDRKDAYSICMHRDDAKTVSLSVIKIDNSEVSFQYWDGAPCSCQPSETISLVIDEKKTSQNV